MIATNGIVFSNNRVVNIVAVPQGNGHFESAAVVVGAGDLTTMSGGIILEDNIVENAQGDGSYGFNLLGFGTWARIARNVVHGAQFAGIWAGGSDHPITIEDNEIVPGAIGHGNAILAGVANYGGTFLIRGNRVLCESSLADGIQVAASLGSIANSAVINNQVTMHNSQFGGISIYGSIKKSLVWGNILAGDGAYAMQSVGSLFGSAYNAESNTFASNDITQFRSAVADVFFDTNTLNSLFIGPGMVIDQGIGNRTFQVTNVVPSAHMSVNRQGLDLAQKRASLESIAATRASHNTEF